MKRILFLALLAVIQPSAVHKPQSQGGSLNALIVGGGPDLDNNQVAIESNVRYVDRLLNARFDRRILFADGDPTSRTVLYEDSDQKPRHRAPEISRIDGPSRLSALSKEFDRLTQRAAAAGPDDPILLYFTGHGNGNEQSDYNNNYYDLWDDQQLSVRRLAGYIDELPPKTPVTLVMVQCFSGAFGNLIFQGGDPAAPLADRTICGFFAAVAPRMAAGCTPSINEADYQDFTGYFFGALTGVDRLGRKVTGADYKHDGQITMSEAYAYALIHDDSIDTPTCTSDTFLRRFMKTPDPQTFSEPWSRVRSWATKPQLAALDALSGDVYLSGEDRPKLAYERFNQINPDSEDAFETHLIRFVRLIKSVVLAHQLRASSDAQVKARFETLVKAEDSNPLGP